jgi:hypothetical protein
MLAGHPACHLSHHMSATNQEVQDGPAPANNIAAGAEKRCN